jgi:hypothetical protein
MLMAFEGFTLNAIVKDTIEVVGGPLADGRLERQASRQPPPRCQRRRLGSEPLMERLPHGGGQRARGLRVRVGSTR